MPNWCYTTYKCVGDEKELNELFDTIKKAEESKESIIPNGFGKLWIGNIIHLLGYNWEEYRCRGEIHYYEIVGDYLVIEQETAWCEQEGFREVIEKKFPSIKVYYQDEESGCGVYCTNDINREYFTDKFNAEVSINNNFYTEYFEDAKDLNSWLSNVTDGKVNNREEADTFIPENEDDYISIHEYEVVNN